MRSAVLFRTHFRNRYVMDAYRQLKVQASNVYFLYHDESPAAADSNSADTFVFASRHVKEHNWVFRDFWRDGHLLLFALEHPDYDYYWMVEYDVRYTGHWREFFSFFDDTVVEDYLASYIMLHHQNPQWNWWNSINFDCPIQLRRRSFFPVVRLSNRAVKLLIDKVGRGASGMCEVIVPALLLLNDMTVGDLNQFGKEVYRPDTFSYRYHFVAFLRDKKSVLYHPVYGFLTRR
jgi:hypothetical protein